MKKGLLYIFVRENSGSCLKIEEIDIIEIIYLLFTFTPMLCTAA